MKSAFPQNLPQQYQKGYSEFYKLKFKVTPDVLIPRPETELLVEQVLKLITHYSSPITILDIGTGSGCIAISIAKNAPNAKIIATDISPNALKIAKQNAKFHHVENQILFIESNLLDKVAFAPKIVTPPDIIITNLPYIPSNRINKLDSSVKDFEPHLALNGGSDGFEIYRQLFVQMIQKNLYPKYLLAEIDHTHSKIAIKEAEKYFPNCKAEIKKDLAKKNRFLVISF